VTAAFTARARTLVTKMMFWTLAGVTFSAAKIVSCNKNIFFMVYLRHYFNCSTLGTVMLVDGNSTKMVGVVSLTHESCDTALFTVMHPIGGWKKESSLDTNLGLDWFSEFLCGSRERW
jgi:hypothetical protein